MFIAKRLRARTAAFIAACATVLALTWLAQSAVFAHPLAQGALIVRVHTGHVELELHVPFEEVVIASTATLGQAPASLEEGLKEHGAYLLSHVLLEFDGKSATGSVLHVEQSSTKGDERVTYTLRYELAVGMRPKTLRLSENVLSEIEYAPGNPWEATYIVSVTQPGGTTQQGLLMTPKQPLSITLNWEHDAGGMTQAGRWTTFRAFCFHGITHILTGYDHLLFIASLVIAAKSFFDLFKVVATFTVAHGLTLTLSVLNLVRLSEHVVEPMIAASIVYVALENIFYPQRSQNWTRLASAFFFGLFHGLGFAGGLLGAMEGMPGTAVAIALLAFSVGVELGHQVVVIPVYAALSAIRRTKHDEVARTALSIRIQRHTSLGIAAAGLFYLVTALTMK